MDRGELTITVLGLVATFCLPWPGADNALLSGRTEGARAVLMVADPPRAVPQMATVDRVTITTPAIQPAR